LGPRGRAYTKFSELRRLRDDDEPVDRKPYAPANSWSQPARAPVVLRPPVPVAPPPPKPTEFTPDFGVKTVDMGCWSSDGRYWLWQPPREKQKEW
jgi:hypothetical protein